MNLSDDVCRLDYREVLEGLGQDLVRLDVPPAQALQTIFLWFGRVRFEVTAHVPDSVPVREGSDESVTLSRVLMLQMVLDLAMV